MKHQKIAPGLLGAVLDYQRHGASRVMNRAHTMSITSLSGTQKEPRLKVFLRCTESADFGALSRSHQVIVNATRGRIRTAHVPLRSVDALSEHPDVIHIAPSRPTLPRLDVALPRINVPAKEPMPTSATDKNTVRGSGERMSF